MPARALYPSQRSRWSGSRSWPGHASACGDKFLVRLERDPRSSDLPIATTRRPATILFYRPANVRRDSGERGI